MHLRATFMSLSSGVRTDLRSSQLYIPKKCIDIFSYFITTFRSWQDVECPVLLVIGLYLLVVEEAYATFR